MNGAALRWPAGIDWRIQGRRHAPWAGSTATASASFHSSASTRAAGSDEDEQMEAELWSLVEAARAAGTTEDTMGLHLLTAWAQPRNAERSLELARETVETAERHRNTVAAAHGQELLAIALTDLGRTAEARPQLAAALSELVQVNQPACLLHCAESIGWYLYRSGEIDTAAEIYSAAVGLRERLRRRRAGFEIHASRQLAAQHDLPVQPSDPIESIDIDGLVAMMAESINDDR